MIEPSTSFNTLARWLRLFPHSIGDTESGFRFQDHMQWHHSRERYRTSAGVGEAAGGPQREVGRTGRPAGLWLEKLAGQAAHPEAAGGQSL